MVEYLIWPHYNYITLFKVFYNRNIPSAFLISLIDLTTWMCNNDFDVHIPHPGGQGKSQVPQAMLFSDIFYKRANIAS